MSIYRDWHGYAGTVMTSFYYATIQTLGNWFQTNQPEHELDDCTGDPVTSLCVTNEKDMALQQQIWSSFISILWCSKSKITDGTGILVLVRVLWDMISKIYWQFWHSFFKNALESRYNFNSIEITWRKMVPSVCLPPVSMALWHCIHQDISLYQHIGITVMMATLWMGRWSDWRG